MCTLRCLNAHSPGLAYKLRSVHRQAFVLIHTVTSKMAVHYQPPQPSANTSTTPVIYRKPPWRLLISDIFLILKILPWLPFIFIPLHVNTTFSELSLNYENIHDTSLLIVLFVLGLLSFSVTVFVSIFMTGWFFLGFLGCNIALAIFLHDH